MKTAISIPDDVFRRAERFAKKMRLSRSQLYTKAIEAMLKAADQADVRASYDRAFGPEASSDDTDALRREAATRQLRAVEW